jgi:hypothetical protein
MATCRNKDCMKVEECASGISIVESKDRWREKVCLMNQTEGVMGPMKEHSMWVWDLEILPI